MAGPAAEGCKELRSAGRREARRGEGRRREAERGAQTVNRKMSRLIFINRQMLLSPKRY